MELDDFYKEKAIGESAVEFYVLVDRIRLKGNRQRIADALETAFREGNGRAIVETTNTKTSYSDRFECRNCGILIFETRSTNLIVQQSIWCLPKMPGIWKHHGTG